MDEPEFADTGALINGKFTDRVVADSTGRENFRDPIRSTAHSALIDLLEVANYENVGLHYGVDLVVCFVRLGQANVERRDDYAPRFAFERSV
jgi:hypothetical protein